MKSKKFPRPVFRQVGLTEAKFDYRDHKFILKEKNRGVLGIGSAVQLYELVGVESKHVKEIGWTRSDNHSGPAKTAFLQGIVSFEDCKTASLSYIDSILD
jgi:hypothetical protein